MSESSAFTSLWTQNAPYWLVVEGVPLAKLEGFVTVSVKPLLVAMQLPAHWSGEWRQVAQTLSGLSPNGVGQQVALIAGEDLPPVEEVLRHLRPMRALNAIANNLWLVDEVRHGNLSCYFQRVLDRRGAEVGFEAFARMESTDGGIIGGGAIMQAATALQVEYQIDRLLHKRAIAHYAENHLHGYLFINFLTGFIQRPQVYLEGLSEAAKQLDPKQCTVVLDVPLANYTRDMSKLRSIAEYCHTRGFALALDDAVSPEGLAFILQEIRPAMVKIDGKFGAGLTLARRQSHLRDIVRLAHSHGAQVLAEGVETMGQHEVYLAAEIDLFQGYLFGAPSRHPVEHPVEAVG